jgi:hypothetical protein
MTGRESILSIHHSSFIIHHFPMEDIKMTKPIDNPDVSSLTDDEMLNILRQVQAGALSVEQAEGLLGERFSQREAQGLKEVAPGGQEFSAPLGKSANGKLIFERGAAYLTLRGEPLLGQLFRAHFGEHHVPIVRVNGGAVTVRYRDYGFGLLNWLRYGFNPPRSDMSLNAEIPWQIDLHSGVAQSRLDLQTIKLRSISLHGGGSDVELRLGEPEGRVSLDFLGGVNNIKILRPASVAVRLELHGGAANLALDNQKFGAIGGSTTLETPNRQEATTQYVITINGGAHNFSVATL